ncbi:MAG: MFS transporter, partial [Deltaproteobacteria bacterium]|nr:MFS transporter [Deltaproteobacteria bacterium]
MNTSADLSAAVPEAAAPEPSRGRVLGLLTVGHGVTHIFQGTMNVCLPLVVRDFGISYTDIGVLRSAQRVSHILSITIGGLATDLLRDRRGVLLLSLLWPSLFVSLQGFSPTFWVFGALVCVQALLGGFMWHAPARAVVGEKFPDRMGFALGVHAMGANVGAAVA